MNQAIQKLPENAQLQTNQAWESKLELVKKLIAPKATPDEFETFLYQCRKMGLDPLAKQIYFNKYETKQGPKMTIIVSIDGYRLVASRTGEYAGSETTFQNDTNGHLLSATTTVYRFVANQKCSFAYTAFLDEFKPSTGRDAMWQKMPHVMLAKCSETNALRKAFPNELSGTYAPEEMNQAEVTTPTVTIDIEPTTGEVKEGKHEEPAPQVEENLWETPQDRKAVSDSAKAYSKEESKGKGFATDKQIGFIKSTIIRKGGLFSHWKGNLLKHLDLPETGEIRDIPFDKVNDALAWLKSQS